MQIPIHRRTDTQIVVYPHDGILCSSEKEQTAYMGDNMDKSRKHFIEPKELDTEESINMIP